MTERPDDHELERLLRDGLERRARRADVAAPVVARARAAARRRRTARVSAGVAAAAVVAVAGVAVAVAGDPDRPAERGPASPGSTASGPLDLTVPEGWRVESWRGIEVSVPPDWGWGTAPIRPVAGDDLALCGGPGAMVTAAGEKLANPGASLAYVGRPVLQSDVCLSGRLPEPEAPYVWLGAALEPGTVEVGGGYVQETVEVAGVPVTVATADEALRAQVLASARAAGPDGCESEREAPPPPVSQTTFEGRGQLRSARVCAYRRLRSTGPLELVHAADLAPDGLADTLAAVDAAPRRDQLCKNTTEVVVVEATYLDPSSSDPELWLHERTVFDLTCGTVASAGDPPGADPTGVRRLITEDSVRPWARTGAGSVLIGPPVPWVYDYFIGMQG